MLNMLEDIPNKLLLKDPSINLCNMDIDQSSCLFNCSNASTNMTYNFASLLLR